MSNIILFFKGYVGPYLRGGKIVNARGYQGRSARAHASAGQMSLFGGEPQHTEPTRELIEEHERLVDVLNSPSHEDDKVEAKKQAEELAGYKEEAAAAKEPTKAQQTRSRRKAVLEVLGEGWKADAGVDGAKDKYSKVFPKAEGGKLDVTIMPEKTVDGNFYVGSYHRGGKRRGAGSNGYAQTIEEAKAMAERFAGVSVEARPADPEAELRAMWTKQGVSQERQDALIAQIGGKAAPGAKVGPFTVPGGESVKPAKPAQQDLVDHIKYLGGERKKDLLELAAFIDDYGYSNSAPDNVHIPVKNAAAAINHITRTSRISTEHGLAARKLTGAKARKLLADVAAAGGLGSLQDHIDAFHRIMGGSTMTKSIVFLRRSS